jgi:hypothetical protein
MDTLPRGKPVHVKAFAVYMYTMCNASLGMMGGRTLGVSDVGTSKNAWKQQIVTVPEF